MKGLTHFKTKCYYLCHMSQHLAKRTQQGRNCQTDRQTDKHCWHKLAWGRTNYMNFPPVFWRPFLVVTLQQLLSVLAALPSSFSTHPRCDPVTLYQGSHYILVVKFKDFQGSWSCIFKDRFSTEVYSMDSIKAIFSIYFCDYETVLVDKNRTWQLLANLF